MRKKFEEIIVENSPNMEKEIVNESQEAQRVPYRINPEEIHKDTEELKNKYTEKNNIIAEIKNTVDEISSRISEAEERISELEVKFWK